MLSRRVTTKEEMAWSHESRQGPKLRSTFPKMRDHFGGSGSPADDDHVAALDVTGRSLSDAPLLLHLKRSPF